MSINSKPTERKLVVLESGETVLVKVYLERGRRDKVKMRTKGQQTNDLDWTRKFKGPKL